MDIRLKRLELENFKCHAALRLDFDGGNASIYGDNATGKTSVYDALTWLLFGKDSSGNGEKNIEIKPLDGNGEVRDHLAVTAVEAVLLADGEEVRLRRTYREIWSTKRGSSEATYDGNTSEYYVDGVPCKKNAFQERVGQLVDEDTFRMLTSVSYFSAGMSWQERRAALFRVAGVMDDIQILGTDERFAPMLEGMGRLSVEDYKKKLLSQKKGYVGAKTEIPARISECEKTIDGLREIDFAAEKEALAVLNAKRDGISSQLLAIEHDSAAEQKRLEIRQAELEISKLESENKAFRAEQNVGTACAADIRRDIVMLQARLGNRKLLLEGAEKTIADCERKIGEYRDSWASANNEAFSGGKCPTCGQDLPEAQRRKAAAAFEAQKNKRLREIEALAESRKDACHQAEDRRAELQQDISELEAQITRKQAEAAQLEGQAVEVRDMDGFAERKQELNRQLSALKGELEDLTRDSYNVKEGLRREMAAVNAEIGDKMNLISKESLLDYSRKRVEELRADAKSASVCLESIEKMLVLMDEYSRYKTRFVEDSINSCFRIARFRLFREQANGGVEDRCDVVYDGIPYMSLNNGMKTNVGIDIINTLSRAYGVRVPLFVDNAESVTRLEVPETQTIRLVVSESDKVLRVQYEN